MMIKHKAGNSAGAKKGWAARLRGGIKKAAGHAAQAGLGAVYGAGATHSALSGTGGKLGHVIAGSGISVGAALLAQRLRKGKNGKFPKKMSKSFYGGAVVGAAGRALGPLATRAMRNRKNRYKSPMDKKGQIDAKAKWKELLTFKAGNSAGVKKSWATRLRRGVGQMARRTPIGLAVTVGQAIHRSIPKSRLTHAQQLNKTAKLRSSIIKRGGLLGIAKKKVVRGVRKTNRKILNFGSRMSGSGNLFPSTKEMNLIVTKDINDKWRWTLLSSNAFEDRDGEVIRIKALEEDLDRSEKEYEVKGNYGPLRWWHVVKDGGDPVKDGLDIGTCDFRALDGRILVESGTFYNETLGSAFAKAQKELGVSVGFFHSTKEPDADKVFNSVRIFERSLLPLERASNPFTQPIIQKEGGIMVKEKLEKLAAIMGHEGADATVKAVQDVQKAAEDAGVRTKEAQVVATKDENEGTELTYEDLKEAMVDILTELAEEGEAETDETEETDTKEVDEFVAAFKEMADVQDKLVETLKALDERLKALEGDQPQGTRRGFSASSDNSTVTKKEHGEPSPDPMHNFLDGFILKK